jgi:hypothetical protein
MRKHFQLRAVYAVVYIFPFQLQKFSFCYIMKASHTGHFSVVAFQVEYGISIFVISIHDMLYISCYCLQSVLLFCFSSYAERYLRVSPWYGGHSKKTGIP